MIYHCQLRSPGLAREEDPPVQLSHSDHSKSMNFPLWVSSRRGIQALRKDSFPLEKLCRLAQKAAGAYREFPLFTFSP
jgi:hypothetical protein